MSAPVFYPGPPDVPRLQFLTSFNDAEQWISRGSSFADFIVGAKATINTEISQPYGIAARDGRIYICDLGIPCIHVIDLGKKTYNRLGTRDQIKKPVNITIAPDGTRYVCDTDLRQVAVFDAQDRFLRHLGDPQRCVPIDLAVSGDELLVADVAGGRLEAWSKDGKLLRVIAEKGRGPGQLREPANVDVDSQGRIYVSDKINCVVNVYDRDGRFLNFIGAPGDRPGFFARPKGVVVDRYEDVFVADSQWDVVQGFRPDGRLLIYFGGASVRPEGMGSPTGLAIDATSLEHFRPYINKDFDAEYLLLLTNEFGKHKIGVYAFGNTKAAAERAASRPATRPATTRAATQPATAP